MLSKIKSASVVGIDGIPVEVEVDISNGLPMFSIVGLPDSSVRESKDRVKAAINNSGYSFPNKRLIANLAPADLKKEGAGFDLPIAIGILSAAETINSEKSEFYSFVGELSLDGEIKSTSGILAMTICAKKLGLKGIVVPEANKQEAAIVQGIDVIPAKYLHEVVEFLVGQKNISPVTTCFSKLRKQKKATSVDFSDVKGQEHAKRAFEIAATGNHNILLKGPPGSGKTMLARRLATILPDLSFDETIEITNIFSISKLLNEKDTLITERPFRSPHHTISDAGLIGGGSSPKPGEISLAHNGVLFLDELPEFKKHVLESLRQPIEDGKVTVSRATHAVTFPTNFLLVCSLNPCPCGYLGDKLGRCNCSHHQIQRYQSKISGPLLDRIDICIDVPAIAFDELKGDNKSETSESIRERVNTNRNTQQQRFKDNEMVSTNSQMGTKEVELHCNIGTESQLLLKKSVERLGLSARGYHRVLRIARTIADMDNQNDIQKSHVAEAIQYRRITLN